MAGAVGEVALVVENYTQLMKTLKYAPKDVRLGVRKEYRTIARPVKATAEGLALSEVRNIGPAWSKFRIGITQSSVYVAPKEKGLRQRGHPRARDTFDELLAERVTLPTATKHRGQVERDFEQMLDRLVTKWDHDGP